MNMKSCSGVSENGIQKTPVLMTLWRRLGAARAQEREMTGTLRALSELEDYQLDDIGLCRSDLTPDGLEAAQRRRNWRQMLERPALRRRAGRL